MGVGDITEDLNPNMEGPSTKDLENPAALGNITQPRVGEGTRLTTTAGDSLAPKPETQPPLKELKESSLGPKLDQISGGGAGVKVGSHNLNLLTVNLGGNNLLEGMSLFVRGIEELAHIAVKKYKDWFGKTAA